MARFVLNERLALVRLSAAPAVLSAPTAAELTAGDDVLGSTDLEELEDIQGFEPQPSDLPMPGYASLRVGSLPGEQTYPASRLSYYLDDTDRTIYSLFANNTTGWLVIMQDGNVVGEDCVVFPYRVGTRVRRLARNVPAIFDVNLSIQVETEGVIAA